jgi:hypothetical protein
MSNSRIPALAKVFGPILLLTAALALPADAVAAPHKAHSAAHADPKNRGKEKTRGPARPNPGRQRQEARQQRLELQRQAQIRRQAELLREERLRRETRGQRGVWDYYPRGRQPYATGYQNGNRFVYGNGSYGPNDRFPIDGFVFDEGPDCNLLRDHQGHVFALVGDIGDLQQGDHVRLLGRVVDGSVCNWQGTGFEVLQVKTLWEDNRHSYAPYDFQRDHIPFAAWLDRKG